MVVDEGGPDEPVKTTSYPKSGQGPQYTGHQRQHQLHNITIARHPLCRTTGGFIHQRSCDHCGSG